jgi:hypothetical protein
MALGEGTLAVTTDVVWLPFALAPSASTCLTLGVSF